MIEKRVILFLMLQIIKKIFSPSISLEQAQGKNKKGKDTWAERQIREMAKLGGKLVL